MWEVQLSMHLPPGFWFRGSAKPTQAFRRLRNRAGSFLTIIILLQPYPFTLAQAPCIQTVLTKSLISSHMIL